MKTIIIGIFGIVCLIFIIAILWYKYFLDRGDYLPDDWRPPDA